MNVMRKRFLLFLSALFFCVALLFFSKSHFYLHKCKMKKRIVKTLSREISNLQNYVNDETNTGVVKENKPLVVVIASYNNEKFCEKNLSSVFEQNYSNFRIIYTDDCSSDNTYLKVKSLIKKYKMEDKVTLIHNEKRSLAMQNHYHAIHSCKDDEIIVMLDGDDWFAHDKVLSSINNHYQDPNIWVTYGQAIESPNYNKICGSSLSNHFVSNGKIREAPFVFAMPRTFYAGLFKKIKLSDFLYKGKFFPMSCDLAIMIYLVEMAGNHAICLNDILYIINRINPINDSNVNSDLQIEIDKYVRSLSSYLPLKNLSFKKEIPPYFDIVCFIKKNDGNEAIQRLIDSWVENLPKLRNIHLVFPTSEIADICNYYNNVFGHCIDSFNLLNIDFEITPYVLLLDEKSIFSSRKNVISAIEKMKMAHTDMFLLKLPKKITSSRVELPMKCIAYVLNDEVQREIFSNNSFGLPMILEKTLLNEIFYYKIFDRKSMVAVLEEEPWIKD